MFISNPTTAPTTAQIWGAATRTLTADPATAAGAALLVWASAARTLTALGSGSFASVFSGFTSLAASATASFNATGTIDWMSGAVDNTLIKIEHFRSPNAVNMTSVAGADSANMYLANGGNSMRFNNTDGASAHNYMYSQIGFT